MLHKPDLVAIVAGILAAPSHAQQGRQPMSAEQAASEAVRIVNAAEAEWTKRHLPSEKVAEEYRGGKTFA